MRLRAVIFDLNGTVLSDEDEYGQAFAEVLKSLGVKVSLTYPHISGIGVEENWAQFIKKYKIKTDKTIQDLTAETQREYFRLIPSVTIRNGFFDFVSALKRSGVKIALATSNSWGMVEKIFDQFEIEGCFDCITTAEEVKRKKPDPQIFHLTAEKLGVSPEECLVIEDSEAGIKAARLSKMKVVGVFRNKNYKKILRKADKLVSDFTKLSLSEIVDL